MAKKIHFEGRGPRLTPEQISEFENEIGGRLPDDYKEFLLSQNGGTCEPVLALHRPDGTEKVGWFISLIPGNEYAGIRDYLHNLRDLNPEKADGYVPIASTYSDCDICLACRGDHIGAAYFTAYKYKIASNKDRIPIDVTMEPLADSFSELLDKLVEIPEPYCRVEDLGKRGTADDLAKYLAEGNSINALGKYKETILCRAIAHDNSAMIKSCLKRGASVSGTVLAAVGSRRTHLIEMLVKAGADVNERDEYGHTPLECIGGTALPGDEGKRNRELRRLLVKLGAVE